MHRMTADSHFVKKESVCQTILRPCREHSLLEHIFGLFAQHQFFQRLLRNLQIIAGNHLNACSES